MENKNLGWLTPYGDFVQCSYEEHLNVAERMAHFYYPEDTNPHADDTLLNHGWVKITMSLFDHKYRIYWDMNKHLTIYQKQFLSKYYYNKDECGDVTFCSLQKELDP